MFSNYVKFINIVVILILFFGLADVAEGGNCWVRRMESGECKQPLSRNVSKEDCCSAGSNVGFTERDMNEFEFFFAMALGDRTSCIPCLASCESAKCGTDKRCIVKKGTPKCICSPKCKMPTENRSKIGPSVLNSKKQIPSENLRNSQRNDKKKNRTSNSVNPNKNQRKCNVLHHSSNDTHLFNSTTLVTLKSDKIFYSSSNTHENILSNDGKLLTVDYKMESKKKPDNFNNGHFNSSVHKKRHQKKKQLVKNVPEIKHTSSNVKPKISFDWADKIRSGFIGYDMPYPPNQIEPDQRGTYYNPVCGTDGRTYKTECQLKKRACRQEITSLTVAYRGQCQTSCSQVKCPPNQHCLEDQNLMPHCVTCTMKCAPFEESAKSIISNPSKMVCGADGITYRNLCEIKKTACLNGRSIPVAYRGPCKDLSNCNNIKCKDRQICLNDLITHRPRCVSCSFKCPRRRQQGKKVNHIKLCGTNNFTYYSWCHMMKDSCQTGYFVDTKYNGPCNSS